MSRRSRYRRPRHQLVHGLLERLNADFLRQQQCYFGGGTRIVLELGEYRESAGIDLLCSSRDGYRDLRSTVSPNSLGRIAARPLRLAREITADLYGIRSYVEVGGEKLKFEIINEARIDLGGAPVPGIPLACLDRPSCFAEKLLANCDRWADRSVLSRDLVDLAFMIDAWGERAARAGLEAARRAYGQAVERDLRRALEKLRLDKDYYRKCLTGLAITGARRLGTGLRKLSSLVAASKPG